MAKAGRPKKNRSHDGSNFPTLAQMGLTDTQSSRWQRLATIPIETWRDRLATRFAKDDEISTANMMKEIRVRDETEDEQAAIAAIRRPAGGGASKRERMVGGKHYRNR